MATARRKPAKKAAKTAKAAKPPKATAKPAPSRKAAAKRVPPKAAPRKSQAPPALDESVSTPPEPVASVAGGEEGGPGQWQEVDAAAATPPAVSFQATPLPSPTPSPTPPRTPLAFDPATGDWVRQQPVPAGPGGLAADPTAPDAPATGTFRKSFWDVLLAIDLVILALLFLGNLVVGAILKFAPDSSEAEGLRDQLSGGTVESLAFETLFTFLLIGLIPFLWVVFSRRQMWEGAKRYLRLHSPLVAVIQGVVLTAILLAAVALLVYGYNALTGDDGDNPAVEGMLGKLTWPVAILIALCAGVGEEILFRGVLLRKLGIWPQAILFGLAHATGGYLPQVLFAFGLAVFFGYLAKRGVSLYALITAHVLYDMTLLAVALTFGG